MFLGILLITSIITSTPRLDFQPPSPAFIRTHSSLLDGFLVFLIYQVRSNLLPYNQCHVVLILACIRFAFIVRPFIGKLELVIQMQLLPLRLCYSPFKIGIYTTFMTGTIFSTRPRLKTSERNNTSNLCNHSSR